MERSQDRGLDGMGQFVNTLLPVRHQTDRVFRFLLILVAGVLVTVSVAPTERSVTAYLHFVRTWAFNDKLIAGAEGNEVRVWDAKTGKLINRFTGHKDIVQWVQFSPNGKTLLTSSWHEQGELGIPAKDISVRLWDIRSGKQLLYLPGQVCGEFSPDGRRFLTLDAHAPEGKMTSYLDAAMWDAESGKQVFALDLQHGAPLYSDRHFSRDGKWVVLTDYADIVYVLDSDSGEVICKTNRLPSADRYQLDASNSKLVTAGFKAIQVWDVRKRVVEREIPITSGIIYTALSTDGEMLFGVCGEGRGEYKMTVFRVRDGSTAVGPVVETSINHVVWLPGSEHFILNYGARNSMPPNFLSAYESRTVKEVARVQIPDWSFVIGVSAEGKNLIVGGDRIQFYDPVTLKLIREVALEGWDPPVGTIK